MINVLLVTDWDEDLFLFSRVSQELQRLGLRTRLAHDVKPRLKHRLWTLGMETKVVSMMPLKKFIPPWAEVWQQKDLDKIQEYRTLERAGISVPKWAPVYEGVEPDLSDFDPYVVVKPAWGGRGAFVRIMRREKVSYRPIKTEAMGTISHALIAQEYIHTGAWPISYRVGTVFGEPIYTFRSTAKNSQLPFIGSQFDANFFSGRSIVATAQGCERDEEVPEEVIELARKAHRAFPDIPLLGVDILRDLRSGKLYVTEVNACGRTYQLSEEPSERNLKDFGINLHKQFGGVKSVAKGIYQRLFWKAENHSTCVPNFEFDESQKEREAALIT